MKALKADNKLLSTMASREWIEKQTKVAIPPNKRNGRKQAVHVKYMNNQRAFKVEMGECTNGGRPDKAKIVEEWQANHPDGKKIDWERDTGGKRAKPFKSFPLNYPRAIRKRVSRAVGTTVQFTLDTLFCWLQCQRGKRQHDRSVTSSSVALSIPKRESKGLSATIFFMQPYADPRRKLLTA